jgi:hypothetical protein
VGNLPHYPPVRSSTTLETYRGDGHVARLLGDVVAGAVQYRFLFPVFREGEPDDPCFIVTSELVQALGACRVGIFEPKGRRTLYHEDGPWDRRKEFARRAVEKVAEHLGVRLRRVRPWWKLW